MDKVVVITADGPEPVILCTAAARRAGGIAQRTIKERLGRTVPIHALGDAPGLGAGIRIAIVDEAEIETGLSPVGIGFPGRHVPLGNEGFRVGTVRKDGRLWTLVAGKGPRGIIHGVGALLRAFQYRATSISIPWLCLSSSPAHEFRSVFAASHWQDQGYKWWSLEQWETYVEELQLWGANTLMYLPVQFGQRHGDIWRDGTEHAQAWEAMRRLPEILQARGMAMAMYLGANDVFPEDAGAFPPAQDGTSVHLGIGVEESTICPSAPGATELLLERREELFRRLPHVDYVYVPTTDYGGCACERCRPWLGSRYLPLCREIARVLHAHHPGAKFILSNQGVNPLGMKEILLPAFADEANDWAAFLCLGGGTQTAGLAQMLDGLPVSRQRILLYPEITMLDHWGGLGFTSFLRNYNYQLGHGLFPRGCVEGEIPPGLPHPDLYAAPRREAGFDMRTMGSAVHGSFTYSEGTHDDATKVMWLANDWSPGVDTGAVALDYCRYHFGEDAGAGVFHLLEGLEDRSVRRWLACPWECGLHWSPLPACWGARLADLAHELEDRAADAERRMPGWAREGWRWRSIRQRVLSERIGLELVEPTGALGTLEGKVLEAARSVYELVGTTSLHRLVNAKCTALSYLGYAGPQDALAWAVKKPWSAELNRRGLERTIDDARAYLRAGSA